MLWVDVGSKSTKSGRSLLDSGQRRQPVGGEDVIVFVAGKIVVDVGRRMDVFVEREKKRERARGSGGCCALFKG